MDWLFILIGAVCFVEIFLRLKSMDHIRSLLENLSKILNVIRSSRISDHWKEKVLLRYSKLLFKQSVLIFSIIVISVLIFPVLSIFSKLLGGHFFDLIMSATGIMSSTCIAILYVNIRPQIFYNKGNYGIASRLLHQISLGIPIIGEALFDLEKLLYGSKSTDVSDNRHVFVCGLARAGTTVIMRRVHESSQFCSLTYRDMPFVLAPNLWRKLSGVFKKKSTMLERAHGDGLKVDYDSPEALEEIFWKTECGFDYIRNDCLVPMSASEETIEKFRTYVSLILRESKTNRYLSKNNNNILRLQSIANAFPHSTILIPFRDPVQQAYSLLNQHKRFNQLHSTDTFAKKYMTWLVHHEFGEDHRPFIFNAKSPLTSTPDLLEYWLVVWINTYTYIADHLPQNALLVCYEKLCEESNREWENLAKRIDIQPFKGVLTFSKSYHHIDYPIPDELLSRAEQLYNQLLEESTNHS